MLTDPSQVTVATYLAQISTATYTTGAPLPQVEQHQVALIPVRRLAEQCHKTPPATSAPRIGDYLPAETLVNLHG